MTPHAAIATKAFFGPVFNAVPIDSAGAVTRTTHNPADAAWARKVVLDALHAYGMANPSLATVQIVQAIGHLESYYGKASNPPEWAGSNNWGAVQCCLPNANGECPANTFKSKDYTPKTGKTYNVCFKSYASPEAGCLDMIRTAMKTKAEREAFASGNILAVSTAMYDANYYESRKKKRENAIAYHASGLADRVAGIAAALGEPNATHLSSVPGIPTPGSSAPGTTNGALLALIPLAIAALVAHGVGCSAGSLKVGAYTNNDVVQSALVQTQAAFKAAQKGFEEALIKGQLSSSLRDQWGIFLRGWNEFYAANYDSYCFLGCAAIGDQIDKYNADLKVYLDRLASESPGSYKGPSPGVQTPDASKSWIDSASSVVLPLAVAWGLYSVSTIIKRLVPMPNPSIDIPYNDVYSALAGQTSFPLSNECNSGNAEFYVNGVRYGLGTDFTVDTVAGVVTWTDALFALELGDAVTITYWP